MSAAENMQWFLSDWNMHLSSSFHSSSVSLAYFVSHTDSILHMCLGEERLIFSITDSFFEKLWGIKVWRFFSLSYLSKKPAPLMRIWTI